MILGNDNFFTGMNRIIKTDAIVPKKRRNTQNEFLRILEQFI